MPQNDDLVAKRQKNTVREGLSKTGLYHSFRLPDGRILQGSNSLEDQESRLAAFGLPEDLAGKRVLDIGPWDGYFSFEMERRGAEVVAIDYVDLDTFRAIHRAFNSRVAYRRMDLYELSPERDGMFDIVLCLGVLYHLKHPLLGLEKICAVTRDLAIIDTVVCDGEAWLEGVRPPIPYVEFYEHDELGGQLDNWSGFTVNSVPALVRAAGFASAEIQRVTGMTVTVAARRHWTNLPTDAEQAITLRGVSGHLNRGKTFQSEKEEYLSLWCLWNEPQPPPLDSVFAEVDGFGIAPLSANLTVDGLHVTLRIPPGLPCAKHQVRVKIGASGWSNTESFYTDLPPSTVPLKLRAAQDAVTYKMGEVDWIKGGWLTLWVDGLTPEADSANTIVEIDGIPHFPQDVISSTGQVNVKLRPLIRSGIRNIKINHRNQTSQAMTVLVEGRPPIIRGLEQIE
jgi:tRNA (mo5U34)-methyltransferase